MHAYLIMAHNQFELLNKLLRALDDSRNDIYIHIDKKSGEINQEQIKKGVVHSNVYFVNRQNVVWGHYSLIECELSLFAEAVNRKEYQYLHLVSGVDFPIKSQEYIHKFFECNKGKEFIHFDDATFPEVDLEKIQCYYFLQKYVGNRKKDSSFLYCIQRAMIHMQKGMKFDRHKRKKMQFYKGANWVSITGKFAKYVVEHKEEIRNMYRYSMCCDEVFLQTMCMNSEFRDNLYDKSFCNDYRMCMRYIDWNRGGPYIFRTEDYDELMKADALFARKFDWDLDREIINKIYQSLGKKNE